MCHSSVLAWARDALTSDLVRGRDVLEVGSYNVNGSVRPIVEAHEPWSYLGVDITTGPGVDLVCDVGDLPSRFPEGFDLVVSTEMLEHVVDWRTAMAALATLTAPGGVLALSTRSPGFPYHPYPIDTWRYPVPTMRAILEALGLDVLSCEADAEAPGVFAVARRPFGDGPDAAALDGIDVPATVP